MGRYERPAAAEDAHAEGGGVRGSREYLEALSAAMALPKVVAVPDQALRGGDIGGSDRTTAQGPPRRQQGRIQDYGERRAG